MNFHRFKIARYMVNSLKDVQHQAAHWTFGSRWNLSPYYWTKFSDKWLTELNCPPTHQHYVYFSFAKPTIFYIIAVLLTTSSYPRLLLDPLTIQPVPSSINSTAIPFINSPFLCNTIPYAILRILFLSHLHDTIPYVILRILFLILIPFSWSNSPA